MPFNISKTRPGHKSFTTGVLTWHQYFEHSIQHSSASNPVQRTGLPCSGVNMSNEEIKFDLPPPWPAGTRFEFNELHDITWLVGPNGSGKSRFLRSLRDCPDGGGSLCGITKPS